MQAPATLLLPSPITELHSPLLDRHGVRLLVKRDDLIHPDISGNKWRKLQHHLAEAKRLGKKGLLTFGGAYSNHLYATAAAGKLFGWRTVCIVRGEPTFPLNPVLQFATSAGMELIYWDRARYRQKNLPEALADLEAQFPDCFLVPEGGASPWGVLGCQDILPEIAEPFDWIVCACGTGTTLAGLIRQLTGNQAAMGIPVLKNAGFLYEEITQLSGQPPHQERNKWQLALDYHFGGYAKATAELRAFCSDFLEEFGLPIEPVYTGKMFYALFDLLQKGYFEKGKTLVALHTGGAMLHTH